MKVNHIKNKKYVNENIKIYYIENFSIPGNSAHSLQIENTIKALSKISNVTLISISFNTVKKLDFCEHIVIKSPDLFKKIIPYRVFYLLYKIKDLKFEKNAYLYTRSPIIAYYLHKKFKKVIVEIHNIPNLKDNIFENLLFHIPLNNFFLNKLYNRENIHFVTISKSLKEDLIKLFSIPEEKITVLPDAVDLNKFNINISKEDAREKLNLPKEKIIITYTGSLQEWKGYKTFLESYKYLKNRKNVIYLIVGGSEDQIKILKKEYENENIIFIPFVEHSKIPLFLKVSDILVIPNSAKYEISVKYTSPLKLFEYMASRRPIIASDLPSIREIVSEEEVLFFRPDNEKDLAEKIEYLLNNKDLIEKLAKNAFEKVKNYTWEKRAKRIVEIFEVE
ncbi:glycosyl transferase group 1 [Methanotorris igneus Kol 5]|uniref:Glycosyl transferase group 1 n=2 Tax=Methanotorris igneus TaxID=2189 RepID=F6BAB0_METIK|nr:glycosyl transferase group 1 [Methanotorris igneus Kol 5]